MNGFLLDTHGLLWSLVAEEKLSRGVREALADPENPVFVSSVTFWEIALKVALGKLTIENYTPEQLPGVAEQVMGFSIIPLRAEEAATFGRLPRLHKDPFDRMLIWQAISRRLTLVSKDPEFAAYADYGLKTLW